MTVRAGGSHRHHARPFRGVEIFGCAGDGGRFTLTNKTIANKTIK
jgi:hypothetical protein